MKHCLVLAPILLSSAAAFTAVHQQFQSFVAAPSSALKSADFDYHGTSNRIQEAYNAWCRVYNKADTSRLEIFAYHFLLAEKFFGQTGAPIKLNEYADLTSAEYMALQETGELPHFVEPTEVIVSETKASDYQVPVPEPIAPKDYGPTAASYLEALSSASQASNTLSGVGMTSYLDSVSTSANTALGGAGMTSYLDTVSGAAPLSNDYPAAAAPSPFASAPVPEPYVPPVPEAYVPPAPVDEVPSTPVAASTGNYMDNLSASSSSNIPQGAGMTSYLDSVASNAGEVRGAGMTSYLDSVASTTYTPFEIPEAPAAPQPFVPPVAEEQPIIPPPPPAQPYVPAESNTVASGGNYMDNLAAASNSVTHGAGISSYLDSVPSNAGALQGGGGLTSYLDNMGTPSDFATVETPPAPIVNPIEPVQAPPVPQEPVQQSMVPPPVPEPVQEAIAPMVVPPKQASYVPPVPSRNIPGAHWMDTVTPLTSYHGGNGSWDDGNYQAANERFKRRRAARRYQEAQTQAYNAASSPFTPVNTPGQQFQEQASYNAESQPSQESIAPLAARVQRRQKRQIETFGGGFIIS